MKSSGNSVLFGIIGMLLSSVGALITISNTQKLLFLVGALFLITSSIIEKHFLYTCLQGIIIAGTVVAFLPVSGHFKALVPLLGGIIFMIVSYPKFRNKPNEFIGALGVITIGAGFAVSHPVIYFTGALMVAIYSLLEFYKGVKIALLWLILNSIFAVTAIVAILQ
ncbi:MAG TPA: hypothetical protein PK821_06765 [Victivallales bacterium]|nr:hypothetical protein [Victivallales bacterium]